MSDLQAYQVWDRGTRWFHWINVLCIIGLMAVGLAILNEDALELSSNAKIVLKTVHVLIGYVFVLNLLWRFVWAFIGNRYARWRAILPFGRGYLRSLQDYISTAKSGRGRAYLGHNPAGRLALALLYLLLTIMAVSGLILAGTDLFYPPFGSSIAQWVAAPGVDPATLVPYAGDMYDADTYQSMRAFRSPVITLHKYSFFALVVMIILHVAAVVISEIREGGGIISAMFTGRKIISGQPADADDTQS